MVDADKIVPAGLYSPCSKLHGEYNADKISQRIKDGANPDSTCLNGMTPLHWSRNGATTKVLIEAGANVNAWDINRNTPLHHAPDAKSVELLIQHGANPNAVNKRGKTPFDTAKNSDVLSALNATGLRSKTKSIYTQIIEMRKSENVDPLNKFLVHYRASTLPLIFGLSVLLLSKVFSKKINAFFYALPEKKPYIILSSLLLVWNPLPLLIASIASIGVTYLYIFQWTPQVVTDTYLLPIVFYILSHVLLVKRYQKNTTHNFNVYCGSMLPFITLLPFYMVIGSMMIGAKTMCRDYGYLPGLCAIGSPYSIITWIIAYRISNKLLNLPKDDQSIGAKEQQKSLLMLWLWILKAFIVSIGLITLHILYIISCIPIYIWKMGTETEFVTAILWPFRYY